MNDNEIIKALECCHRLGKGCDGCPFDGETNCISKSGKAILDLINRQKAEIEELRKYKHDYYVLKSEAIKAFAEKVFERITEIYNKHIFGNNDLSDEEKEAIMNFSNDVTSGIDGLVEEMTEEKTE